MSDIAINDPRIFKTKPYDYQYEGFCLLKDLPYFANTSDMGIGKTKICIDIASYRYLITKTIDAVLIIAPNNVHIQWIDEQYPKHCAVPYRSFIWDGMKKTKKYTREINAFLSTDMKDKFLKVFAVNVESFQGGSILGYIGEYVKNHKPLIVIDESTSIKNPEAKRTSVVLRLNKYGERVIMTGTPAAKSPFNLWAQYSFLKDNFFDCSYFMFQHRYGILMKGVNPITSKMYNTIIDEKTFNIVKHKIKTIKEMRNGELQDDDYDVISVIVGTSVKNVKYIEQQDIFKRFKNLAELKALVDPITFSKKKIDCLDLPTKVYQTLYLDMTKEQRRIYNNLKESLLAQYDGEELSVTNKIALGIRFMQICGGYFPYKEEMETLDGGVIELKKYKQIGDKNIKIEELLRDMEETDEQTIVWANFIPELLSLKKELTKAGYRCGLYYGATSTDDREKIKAQFNAGSIDIFLANGNTAAYGLNLQVSYLQYFFSNNFRTEARLQMEDRSHRIGVKGTCVYKDIVIRDSIDEKILINIREGKELNDFFTKPLKEII